MLRTKKLRKQKKKARSRTLKYAMMLAGITAAGIAIIVVVAALWPTGSDTTDKETPKKKTTEKTVTKKPVKKPVAKPAQPVDKPAAEPIHTLIIQEPPEGFETSQNTATISGNTTQGSTLLVDGKKYEIRQDGTFAIIVELVRGINRFVLTAVSPQKKTAEKEVVINKLR